MPASSPPPGPWQSWSPRGPAGGSSGGHQAGAGSAQGPWEAFALPWALPPLSTHTAGQAQIKGTPPSPTLLGSPPRAVAPRSASLAPFGSPPLAVPG